MCPRGGVHTRFWRGWRAPWDTFVRPLRGGVPGPEGTPVFGEGGAPLVELLYSVRPGLAFRASPGSNEADYENEIRGSTAIHVRERRARPSANRIRPHR